MSNAVASNTIVIEVAPGELVDKLTILDIKHRRIADVVARRNVAAERTILARAFAALGRDAILTALRGELRAVNERLWDIEDAIREHEGRGDFGPGFVALARAVYRTNDERAAIKRRINVALDSALFEEKSYKRYA